MYTLSSMAETLHIAENLSKEQIYEALLPQIKALTETEKDLTANLANIAAALKHSFGYLWVGFYRTEHQELVLGPFQGPVACTRIAYGKGVCGTAWQEKKTIVVPDVNKFPGHIACSSESKSEIVVPVISDDVVHLILDIDSDELAGFDTADQQYLEQLAEYIANSLL